MNASGSPVRVVFLMDQIAGHVTNYRNLRSVADLEPQFSAVWREIHYYRPGGRIEQLRERWLPFLPLYISGNTRGVLEMRRSMKQMQADALFSNASVGVLFARTFARTPTLIDFDSTPVQRDAMTEYTPREDPRPVAYLKWRLCRNMFHSASKLQAWSRWAKQSAVDDYGVPEDRVVVNPPGVDLGLWRPSQRTRPAGSPKRLLFVGGDFERKGGHLVLDWMRNRTDDDVELHIVTRDPVEPLPNVFVHHGVQPNSARLFELYATSDLFVLPSLGECFGIATVEAMASGLPVIASDVGGTADIVEQGVNGFLVRVGDGADLARAIETILRDDALRSSMGVRSRAMAEEKFDVRVNARRTLSLLAEIADGRTESRPTKERVRAR